MAIAMLFLTLPEGAILSMLVELCKKDLPHYSSIQSCLSPFSQILVTIGEIKSPETPITISLTSI
jgi:hypothetical protein